MLSKFHCHCLNILDLSEGGGGLNSQRVALGTHGARFSGVIFSPWKKSLTKTELTVVDEIN